VVYLVSYSVRDILWLRILGVAGTLLLVPYYYLQPTPLWQPIEWSTIFVAINAYWIVRLALERRPVHLTDEEQRLRVLSFPSLTAREALSLFKTGIWENIEPGKSLVAHDRAQARLSVILNGLADVVMHGEQVAVLGEGQFVGEIDARADERHDIDVVVREPARIMCWDRDHLRAFLSKRPDVALALERSIGLQLRRLLDSTMSKLSAE
jgi:CRP-like cAMP-binding protein